MEDAVKKAGGWASNISSVGKLVGALILVIVAVSAAWYQIEANAVDNVRQDEHINTLIINQQSQFDRMMEGMVKEFKVHADRSDKRYNRAMKEAEELHRHDDKHDEQIVELTKELWYIKGKLESK